jgi:hypothetical protein
VKIDAAPPVDNTGQEFPPGRVFNISLAEKSLRKFPNAVKSFETPDDRPMIALPDGKPIRELI